MNMPMAIKTQPAVSSGRAPKRGINEPTLPENTASMIVIGRVASP